MIFVYGRDIFNDGMFMEIVAKGLLSSLQTYINKINFK